MNNNSNILVIHPADITTNFLCQIYRDINATVVRQTISSSKLKKLIKDADRIIILGHGTKDGMGPIDSSLVYLLREKRDSIFIWCNADEFVKKYKLSGFATGMFISEMDEADYYLIKSTSKEIEESNDRFAKVIRNYVHKSGETIKNILKENYALDSDVARYNKERFYYFSD